MLAAADLTDKLEKNYLKLIIQYLKDGTLTLPDSRAVTREFLALQPFASAEDAQKKIVEFTAKHLEFKQLEILLMSIIEEEKTDNLLAKMRSHLENNNIDAALSLVPKP